MKHRRSILFVAPQAGLCNRMRTMLGAIALAKETHSKVVFFWESNGDLNAPFKTLFEHFPYPVIEFKQGSSLQSKIYKVLGKLCVVAGDDYVRAHCKKPQGGILTDLSWYDKGKSSLWFFVTCEQFYPVVDYSIFQMRESLKALAPQIDSHNTIGIHIRRTDNQPSIKYSPTSLFVSEMEKRIQDNPEVRYFLSTDDLNEEQTLINRFGNRIITYKKRSISRNTQEGIEDAAIDLYLLSHCQQIFGSYYSSFSDVAAMWGNIVKTVIKKDED